MFLCTFVASIPEGCIQPMPRHDSLSAGWDAIFEGKKNNSISSYSVCLKCCKLIKIVLLKNDKLMSAFMAWTQLIW